MNIVNFNANHFWFCSSLFVQKTILLWFLFKSCFYYFILFCISSFIINIPFLFHIYFFIIYFFIIYIPICLFHNFVFSFPVSKICNQNLPSVISCHSFSSESLFCFFPLTSHQPFILEPTLYSWTNPLFLIKFNLSFLVQTETCRALSSVKYFSLLFFQVRSFTRRFN